MAALKTGLSLWPMPPSTMAGHGIPPSARWATRLFPTKYGNMGMGQNPIPLVNIKIAGKWMFIPLKMVCIGIDP